MFIRKAELSDLDAVVALDETFGEENGEPVYSSDQWHNFINGDETVFCCQGDDGIIAVLLAMGNHDESLQLQKIFVLEDYRDEGVGHYLMEQFDELQADSRCVAFLCVSEDNADAQRFYTQHGFTLASDDGEQVHMSREL